MKIHEYQAKIILKEYGVTVPSGEVAYTPSEAKDIAKKLGGACVLKAQIHAGGRGKGGGIKIVTTPEEAEEAAKKGKTLFFLGGRDGVAGHAARILKSIYPNLNVVGVSSPYIPIEGRELLWAEDEDRMIAKQINESGADILLIGFGNPKQEIWFERNRNRLNVPVSIGVGGTFEFISGITSRAPLWMQKMGMEWFFRLCMEPKRLLKRYIVTVPLFIYYNIVELIQFSYNKVIGRT